MAGAAYAQKTVVTQTPYNNRYYPPYHSIRPGERGYYTGNRGYYSQNFTDMSALEKYALNRNYYGESELSRLQRLERQAFGAVQQGDFDRRYENVRAAILSRPQQSATKTVLRNMNDYFNGQLTGFTPQINSGSIYVPSDSFGSFNPYASNYGTKTIQEYGRGPWSRGYRAYNYGSGTSSGVRILD